MRRVFFVFAILTTMLANASAASPPPVKWDAAVVTGVSASAESGGFTVTANVELPQPKACYDVQIAMVPMATGAPHYAVQQARNEKFCTEVITAYTVSRHFATKPIPKSVDVDALDEQRKSKHWIVPVATGPP
jgi:hypothetical protein